MRVYVCMCVQVCASGLLAPKQVRSAMVPLDAKVYQDLLQVIAACRTRGWVEGEVRLHSHHGLRGEESG